MGGGISRHGESNYRNTVIKTQDSCQNNSEPFFNVLFIDPWGINEAGEYTNNICSVLSKYVNLTLITNHFFQKKTGSDYYVIPCFFKYSESMNKGIIRKTIRGIEYINAWEKIVREVKSNRYDAIHINWLLCYKIDIFFLKKIKKYNIKIIYTAHNVLPHVNGELQVDSLDKIYDLVDKIILHGNSILDEFNLYFSKYNQKVYIQKHGCNVQKNTDYDIDKIDKGIVKLVNRFQKVFLFVGNVFANKGVDRLLKIWLNNPSLKDYLLIVAGREIEIDDAYKNLKKKSSKYENILILDYFISNNYINFLMSKADIVVLPYRHASMSGVVFTAADFSKPVIATRVGALPEYLSQIEGCVLVDNSMKALEKSILQIAFGYDRKMLSRMGDSYKKGVFETCAWDTIGKALYHNCYKQCI